MWCLQIIYIISKNVNVETMIFSFFRKISRIEWTQKQKAQRNMKNNKGEMSETENVKMLYASSSTFLLFFASILVWYYSSCFCNCAPYIFRHSTKFHMYIANWVIKKRGMTWKLFVHSITMNIQLSTSIYYDK